jgi:phenylalanyl-tRNA synthetase beta chain
VGIEVETITNLGAGFTGVVVAEVVGVRPHPSADKLRLVDVITAPGGAATQVVCGAPNVPAPGGRVLWAQPGATLPGGLTLATKPVKGVDSPGMLCAEDELGIGDDEAGIIVLGADDRTPLGERAQVALGVDDVLLEVAVPANRPDVLGHLGVARELVARRGGRVVLPDVSLAGQGASAIAVGVEDPGARRYIARALRQVTVAPSPRKFAQRLRGVGVRPISNVVDVTNYVMFELGQPLHAFDAAQLRGGRLAVRAARVGESLTTLDGVARLLAATDLVIVDGERGERAVALAGVMGGQSTEVGAATTAVALESACFDPRRIKATARRLGLHSESSLRFERGVDPELAALASARAATLLTQLAGATADGGPTDGYPSPAARATVPLRRGRLASLTGVTFAPAEVDGALTRLGCELAAGATADELRVTVPSWRTDLAREVDLIEDVLRVLGLDRVPSTMPALRAANPLIAIGAAAEAGADEARRILAATGMHEAITFGFQSFARLEALRLPAGDRRARPDRPVQPDERRAGHHADVAGAQPAGRARAQRQLRPPRRRAVRGRAGVPASRR